jgi:MlaC protein
VPRYLIGAFHYHEAAVSGLDSQRLVCLPEEGPQNRDLQPRLIIISRVSEAMPESRPANRTGRGAKDLFVSYRMHFVEENWKVYDVIIDDVSLIDNYRAQFHRVITQSSFEGLIRINRADVSD